MGRHGKNCHCPSDETIEQIGEALAMVSQKMVETIGEIVDSGQEETLQVIIKKKKSGRLIIEVGTKENEE